GFAPCTQRTKAIRAKIRLNQFLFLLVSGGDKFQV
ncbi:hypothetical protein EfmU0317_1735, partial [Enterococcus faecium U0317]